MGTLWQIWDAEERRNPVMTKLSQNTLSDIASIPVPAYDRAAVRPGIVHIGVGGFNRAHQCSYIHDLLSKEGGSDWGIIGCGILPSDAHMRDIMERQNCLYTLVTRDADGDDAVVIGSMLSYLHGPSDPEAVIEALASPDTRIVSLTITEGGYNIDDATGEFKFDNPDVQHDLTNKERPRSAFGYLTAGLRRRKDLGIQPFTVLSCDNLQSNGNVARRTLLAFAERQDPPLAEWISANVTFPNSMVDRITPQTTDEHRALLSDEFGVEDEWPVVCEPFRQWVIEDKFVDGRPPLELVGAQFVPDVHPYEMMKIRLLNASHSAMGYLGYLAGHRYINEVIDDPLFRRYIQGMMDDEVTPLLQPVPGIDLVEYKSTLIQRFSNPRIRDQVLRICLDGSSKMPKFILPSITEQIARGGDYSRLALCVASWIRFLSGRDEQGNEIPIQDPIAEKLHTAAVSGQADPRPVLSIRQVFGDLADNEVFVKVIEEQLQILYRDGAVKILNEVVQ